jgi:hypothetical protein
MSGRVERFVALALRMLPEHRRDLGAALLAELSVVPTGWPRLRWLLGGLWFVAEESARRVIRYGSGLAAAAVALAVVDQVGTSDDSSQVSLLLLLVAAAGFGFAAPRRAWVAGIVLGSAVAVSEISVAAWSLDRARGTAAGGVPAAATLLVLIAPAFVSAYLGAGAAWLRRRSRWRKT